MSGSSLTDLARIRQAPLSREPYPHFLCSDLLRQEKIEDLRGSFPEIDKPGYLTVEEVSLKGAFRELIEQLEGDEVSEALSEKFGQNLHPYPRLTTVMRWSQRKYGAIHTDGASKVMTMLVYMNDAWNTGEGGRLRVLYDGKNYEPFAVEVPPVMGTAFAFLRSDNSWHGHLPFTGERKVVQIAWIKDRAELERKKRRNSVAQSFKSIFGR
jgi:SM-20-related protein